MSIETLIQVKQHYVIETHWEEVCDLYHSSFRKIGEMKHGPFYYYNEAIGRIDKIRESLSEEGYSKDKNDNELYRLRNYDVRVKLEENLVDLDLLPLRIVRQVRYDMKLKDAHMGN